MKIDHLALWVSDLEGMRTFCTTYFDATPGKKYPNPAKPFTSCFLRFGQEGTRLELMHRPNIGDPTGNRDPSKRRKRLRISRLRWGAAGRSIA